MFEGEPCLFVTDCLRRNTENSGEKAFLEGELGMEGAAVLAGFCNTLPAKSAGRQNLRF